MEKEQNPILPKDTITELEEKVAEELEQANLNAYYDDEIAINDVIKQQDEMDDNSDDEAPDYGNNYPGDMDWRLVN